jgi:hypothetical protein
VALARAGLWWREANLRQSLVADLAALKSAPPVVAAAPAAVADGAATSGLGDAVVEAGSDEVGATLAANRAAALGAPLRGADDSRPVVASVPYGENALTGPRIELLRQVFTRLAARNYTGIVEVRTFPGRFCLVGNANEGFSVAPDELAFSRCNSVGNPHEDALDPSQRESLSYANLVGEFRSSTQGALDIRLTPGDSASVTVAYPQVSGALTAGEWNRAAAANNRVEIRLR